MLATLRLIEQGELAIDGGIDTLQRTLEELPQQWIDEVSGIVWEDIDWEGDSSVGAGVFDAVVTLAARSLDRLGGAFCNMSRRISTLKH